jgi:maltooligosyltrehalose trehalohydrolase
MDVLKRNIGLTFNDDHWVLRVWAPEAGSMQLKLTATGLTFELNPQDYGYWELEIKEISGGDRYWLVIDGRQLPDPAAVSQPDGVYGPSQAMTLQLDWEEAGWNNLPLKDYIFYELHTGTFSARGDFEGIAQRLDHLIDLGITAIEIMPVASFPGERNWGYDGVFPFAVQNSYGGAQALLELVSLCHRKGLAVVLDVVYNHLGPEGNCLPEFGPYFTDKYRTPWGNAVNFDDRGAHGVREYFIENVLMWFRDFHVDALRLDAVHAIKDFSATHILQEIRRRVDLLSEQTGKTFYLIAECDLNDPRYITELSRNGLGMDSQWIDEFHHALRVSAGEPRKGYYSDFNGVEHLGKSYQDGYVYTGMYSAERDNFFGRSPRGHAAHQFVVFSQNHDQVGNRMLGERSSTLVSFEMQKLMAAAVLNSPFLPMLFMGEEWGETNPFQYFIDHSDKELVDLVRKGRKDEFKALHAQGEAPDPKDERSFLNSKLNWDLLNKDKNAVLYGYYKELISLRKQTPLLTSPELDSTKVQVFRHQNCLTVRRGAAGRNELLLCLMNFSDTVQCLRVPTEAVNLIKVVDSADPRWLGPSASAPVLVASAPGTENEIIIQPQSFLAYSALYA